MTTIDRMTTAQLVAEYNRLNPEKPVKRFSDRATAIKRVYAALGQQPSGFPPAAAPEPESNAAPATPATAAPAAPEAAPVVEDAAEKAGGKPNARKPKKKAVKGDGPRPGSKRAELLELLRGAGVTADAACKKFGWQPRDFKDAIRLLKSHNGVNAAEGEDGKWRAK